MVINVEENSHKQSATAIYVLRPQNEYKTTKMCFQGLEYTLQYSGKFSFSLWRAPKRTHENLTVGYYDDVVIERENTK